MIENKKTIKLYLAKPRGFCAGVDRAIKIVEKAIEKFGKPVYVRHEIVHNKYVVNELREKGAIFIEEIDEIPFNERDRPLIFSAHGVAQSVHENANNLNIFYIDATCPLVTKVHNEIIRLYDYGYEVLLIGHEGHPEVIGTMGQLPEGTVKLISNIDDAWNVAVDKPDKIAYVSQTTLSVYDTLEIVEVLEKRFPNLAFPKKSDICYATTNRQMAVGEIAKDCDFIYVVGAPNSSNSKRLVEIAEKQNNVTAKLLEDAEDINWADLGDINVLGISAGASAPEILVEEVVSKLKERFDLKVEDVITIDEKVKFNLPKVLAGS